MTKNINRSAWKVLVILVQF